MQQAHDLAKQFFGKFSYRGVLAILIVFGCFTFLFTLLFKPIPEANASAVNVAQGFVLGVLSMVAAYYFGSSKDQSDNVKAANVENIIKSAAPVDEGAVIPFTPTDRA